MDKIRETIPTAINSFLGLFLHFFLIYTIPTLHPDMDILCIR